MHPGAGAPIAPAKATVKKNIGAVHITIWQAT